MRKIDVYYGEGSMTWKEEYTDLFVQHYEQFFSDLKPGDSIVQAEPKIGDDIAEHLLGLYAQAAQDRGIATVSLDSFFTGIKEKVIKWGGIQVTLPGAINTSTHPEVFDGAVWIWGSDSKQKILQRYLETVWTVLKPQKKLLSLWHPKDVDANLQLLELVGFEAGDRTMPVNELPLLLVPATKRDRSWKKDEIGHNPLM